MKKEYILSSFLMIVSFFVFSAACLAAKPNNCVTCHTNDTIMKSLYKAPVLPAGEGEG